MSNSNDSIAATEITEVRKRLGLDPRPALGPVTVTQHDANQKSLRVLSLFAGIGGIDLGLERAGMQIVAHSEIEPYACQVLAKHWPHVPNLGSVTEADFAVWAGLVDVIAGGFPCQDISLAGKGAGIKEGTRSGLWSEYARAIREVRPRYVIVENVAALLARGLDIVLGDLAALGYDAWWDCVPAAAVGAPHRRDRLFIVATRADVGAFDTDTSPLQWASELRDEPNGDSAVIGADPHGHRRGEQQAGIRGEAQGMGVERWDDAVGLGGPDERGAAVADAHQFGAQVPIAGGQSTVEVPRRDGSTGRLDADADSPRSALVREGEERGQVGGGDGGRDPARRGCVAGRPPAEWWSAEPGVGRVAHGVPRRVDRLRCLGNAVVPQVAQYIGELVVAHYAAHALEEVA